MPMPMAMAMPMAIRCRLCRWVVRCHGCAQEWPTVCRTAFSVTSRRGAARRGPGPAAQGQATRTG